MGLFEVTGQGLVERESSRFKALEMQERRDIQRLLRDHIAALGEDLLVIGEEYGHWQDARRRIDLLALDKTSRLVVIEIKRTDDGGHMELQALRYAAMVSSMGFPEVLEAYTEYCRVHRDEEDFDPRADLEAFLDVTEDDEEPVISSDVRIVLVSADFGREITTAVLWLNGFEGMDIRCVRLVPYDLNGSVLLDIQQVIPLPEAADYQVRMRRKGAARERARQDTRDFSRYHIIVDGEELPDENKRGAIRVMVEQLVRCGVSPAEIQPLFRPTQFRSFEGILTPEQLQEACAALRPNDKRERWFGKYPIVDEAAGRTYVVSKGWGLNTEQQLQTLADAFPEAKVSFKRADSDET